MAVSAFLVAARKLYKKSRRDDAEMFVGREACGAMPVGFGILALSAGGSLVAGIIGGLLGLGGGFALGPLLLELGVHPQVCQIISLITTNLAASTMHHYILRKFPDYIRHSSNFARLFKRYPNHLH